MQTTDAAKAASGKLFLSATQIVDRVARPANSKSVVLMVGIPASGKSTFCEELEQRGYQRLSMDALRARLLGDESKIGDDAQQKLVRDSFRKELESALAQGLNVLVDNTNFNQRTRNPVLDRVKRAGYSDVQLLVLDVPLDECLRRNAKRKRVVTESIIRMMHGSLHGDGWPKADEGRVVTIAPTEDRQIYSVQFPEA
jgi:predicted kinase